MAKRTNNTHDDKFTLRNGDISELTSQWSGLSVDQIPFFLNSPISLRDRFSPYVNSLSNPSYPSLFVQLVVLQGTSSMITGFTVVTTDVTLTAEQLKNKLIIIDTSSAERIVTLPSLTSSDDVAIFAVLRDGENPANLVLPGGYNYVYPGGTSSPYIFAKSGDFTWGFYRHSNTTFYMSAG